MKKKEKLELMLNKVVEYNDPKAYSGKGCHFKAFLYKNASGYYFKVVEVMAGTDLAFNDIIPLQDKDEKFLIVADKPKLMVVSKYSWHYKLMKYVLRSNCPTPKDMQNGCPYAWLLVFSMLVVPFIQLYKGIKWVLLLIPKALFLVLEQLVNSWVAGLDDEAAYDVYYSGGHGSTKMPKTAQLYFEKKNKYNTDDEFFNFFLSKKYKDISVDDPDYEAKRQEIKDKWSVWREDLDKRRAVQREETRQKEAEQRKRKAIHDKKREEANARWEAKMEPFRVWRKNTAAWFRTTFTVQRGRVNLIVKRTKQFVGAVVTLGILVGTFFLVNLIARGLMVVADACIANWEIFAALAGIAVACGIAYLLYVLISSWGQALVNKYRRGKKVWYIEPFIYLLWYPVKYIAISIAFLAVYVLWTPIKFIFYTCIWSVLRWLGLGIGRGAVSLGKGIVGSTGIFGEYFGASYSDYCPGLEWVDFDDED